MKNSASWLGGGGGHQGSERQELMLLNCGAEEGP